MRGKRECITTEHIRNFSFLEVAILNRICVMFQAQMPHELITVPVGMDRLYI